MTWLLAIFQAPDRHRARGARLSTGLFNGCQLRKWKVGALPLDPGALQTFTA